MLTSRLNSSRGSRSSTTHTRGTKRGGIKKRKNCPTRVDRDGDMMMDAAGLAGSEVNANKSSRVPNKRSSGGPSSNRPGASGRAKGGSNRAPKPGIHRAQQAILRGIGAQQANILQTLEVTGLSLSKASNNADGGLESLLGFLERKASCIDSKGNRPVKIKKSSLKGDTVLVTASLDDTIRIQKLDKYHFAGIPLSIKPCEQSTILQGQSKEEISAEARNLKDELRAFLATRYNVELKLLDLSMLGTDPRLQGMGIFKEGVKTAGKLFPAIMAICDGLFKTRKEKQDAITSIALTDNSLSTITHISSLSQTFPDIKNLDLSRNEISDLEGLDAWRSKFRSLEVLLLKENPIESRISEFVSELLKRYPRLHSINDVQVRTPEEIVKIISAAEQAKVPIPITGPSFRDVGQIGETFIRHFIPLYDHDRSSLASSAYDVDSTFSLSINMLSPRTTEIMVPVHNWSDYIKYSRNLDKITHLPARMNRQFKGSQSIKEVWASLPETRHPDIETENEKYFFEGHELPCVPDPTGQSSTGVTGMIIHMHGEFQEPKNSTPERLSLRSFSRTFILGPGAPSGPTIRVVSDMLVLRPWAPLAKPSTTVDTRNIDQKLAVSDSALLTGALSAEKQQEIVARQFMEHTGMTMHYSVLCLQQAEWDLQKADVLFNQTKVNLPADAFTAALEQKSL